MILIYKLYCGLEITKDEFDSIAKQFKGNISSIGCSIGLFTKEGKKYVLYNKNGSRIYEADDMILECWVRSFD